MNDKADFHRALSNPIEVDEATFRQLLDKYPYVPALRVAWHRKGVLSQDGSVAQTATILPLYVDYLPDPVSFGVRSEVLEVLPEGEVSVDSGVDEMELLPEHPVSVDYLHFEELDAVEKDEPATAEQPIMQVAAPAAKENLSKYHDEDMPYSFLWWLNKTRMAYADTYQPYASSSAAPRREDDGREFQVLDQQIRENIFHLQPPEEKLSAQHRTKTVAFQVPNKIGPIVERFIKEEPQIKPPQPDKIDLENKARKSAEDPNSLVTETLANIYVEQGLYPKAIAVFKKLSLKYPKKSAYFAARILELEDKLS